MGEVLRHAEIFHNTRERIGTLRPDEDYTYLELGNYLTDVSQFRDPFAHMSAKRTIWQQAKSSNPFLAILSVIPILGILSDVFLDAFDVEEWLNNLMGEHEPADRRYGKLAEYFENVILAVTHVIFADDIPQKEAMRGMLPPELQRIEPIPPAEIDHVYSTHFTQYWPHEHVDFPPFVLHGDQRPRNRMYRRGRRGLIQYLEEYLTFLTEELTKLEADWKGKRTVGRSDRARHDILVRFGKLLHAVEDYFFHSNYPELQLWNDLRRGRPREETDDAYRAWFAENWMRTYRTYRGYPGYQVGGDASHPEAGTHTTWRRKLMRRLRYPVYESGNRLSDETSEARLDLCYTGGFESTDMAHTMAGALESLQALFKRFDEAGGYLSPELRTALGIPGTDALVKSNLVLVRTLFNADERSRMHRDKDYLQAQLVKHVEQINSEVYNQGVDRLRTDGYLNDAARDAFKRAFAIDRGLEAHDERTPGVGGFLMQFLAQSQGEMDRSRVATRSLDGGGRPDPGHVFDVRTDNGASGETIGTHTLMAKDTPKSQPLYEDAKVLAKFASLSVVHLMLTEINSPNDASSGLDWEAVLQELVRFPQGRPGMWEAQALALFRESESNPAFEDVPNRPQAPRLNASAPDRKLLARREGTQRKKLEDMYVALEERVDRYMINLWPG
ncbi:MAG TPA: hypothetical protein VGW75_12095 [Solirubrobacteraceae bacterium]|jgi:hypothetical protein|nr:hypothetical protein [Solirubrobacteraceae bacterium]